jgi:membrane protein implicated in regulation of membrane protease activity
MFLIVWLVALLVFLFVEAQSVTMVSLWFAAGALAALIAALCGAELWLQIVLFFVVSIALLAALRPLARKFFTPKITKTNVDSIIGAQGLVTAPIDNIVAQGQVKLNGMEWTARSTSGEIIPIGTQVVVDKIEGVKVFVTPVQVDAPVTQI